MNYILTRSVFEAHLECRYKAYLRLQGERGSKSDYEMLMDERKAKLQSAFLAKLGIANLSAKGSRATLLDLPLLKLGEPYLLDVTAVADSLEFHFEGLKKVDGKSSFGRFHYKPVLFHPHASVTRKERTLLELGCQMLESVQGRRPNTGVVCYGKECRIKTIRVDENLEHGQGLLSDVLEMGTADVPPNLVLNRHCETCEFQQRCKQKALEDDSLSLIRGIGHKEIDKFSRKGLLTLTQLAHTFRPRRNSRRHAKSRTRQFALQAMAIRDKTIYVLDTPTLPAASVNIYFDCEADPDDRYVYLIGMIISQGDSDERYSFWANNRAEERKIFEQFMAEISKHKDAAVFSYGSYEKQFLRRMRNQAKKKRPVDRLIDELVNVLSLVYRHLYFPCYSNGLKDVAPVLGSTWSDQDASGIQSIVWRNNWENDGSNTSKARLVTYNWEDCAALKKVVDFIRELPTFDTENQKESTFAEGIGVKAVESEQSQYEWQWGPVNFFHKDFDHINKCAYFDYQRQKVFVRTNKLLRGKLRRPKGKGNRNLKISKHVNLLKSKCPNCGKSGVIQIESKQRHTNCVVPRTKRAYDLVFTDSSVKRRVLAYHTKVHQCLECGCEFVPEEHLRLDRHFHGLKSFILYLHIAHRLSLQSARDIANEIFGFSFKINDIHMLKGLMARYYAYAYRKIQGRILAGTLIHADETEAHIRKEKGYVWVFANMEDVIYFYRPTREGEFLKDFLGAFNGVLVTDFYSAYDSLECRQQKCLVHLIQDMNQAILASPFDTELQSLTERFGKMLRAIIGTIDEHGLKQRFMRRHMQEVADYFSSIGSNSMRSEEAQKLRARLLRYQHKLFTFLTYDGIPWNNNNAEHAVKRFVRYRERGLKPMSQQGISDYLVLLSVCETCRYRGISFLDFMLSGAKDIEKFCSQKGRKRQPEAKLSLYPKGFTPPHMSCLRKRFGRNRKYIDQWRDSDQE